MIDQLLAKRPLLQTMLCVLILLPLLLAGGCTCGFDCSSDDDDNESGSALFSLALSGSVREDLSEVVLQIDSVTLRRSDGDDVVIDAFSVGATESDTIAIDLLDFAGFARLEIVAGLEVASGDYNSIVLQQSENPSASYVLDNAGEQRDLLLPSGGLALGGVRLTTQEESFVIDFELARSLDFEVSADQYRISAEGIRLADDNDSARIFGNVDDTFFSAAMTCDGKTEPTEGNRIYVYTGGDLAESTLADVYNSDNNAALPDPVAQPFAIATAVQNTSSGLWEYVVPYLPPGDYVLAFTCDGQGDDVSDYDGLVIPFPQEQRYRVTVEDGEIAVCNIIENSGCTSDP